MATQMDYPDINCEIPIKVNSFQQSAVSSVYIFWIKKNVCMFQPKNWITVYQQKYIINGQNCTQERVEQF